MGEYLVELLARIDEVIHAQRDRWTWLRKAEGSTGPERAVVFAPALRCDTFPQIGLRHFLGRHPWLIFAIEVGADNLLLRFSVYPTADQPLRQRVIGRLVAELEEFDLKMYRKAGMTAKFTTLLAERIIEWREGDEPTTVHVVAEVRVKLDEILRRLAGVPAALQPIFDERRNARI
jgi:hypothetical protein